MYEESIPLGNSKKKKKSSKMRYNVNSELIRRGYLSGNSEERKAITGR